MPQALWIPHPGIRSPVLFMRAPTQYGADTGLGYLPQQINSFAGGDAARDVNSSDDVDDSSTSSSDSEDQYAPGYDDEDKEHMDAGERTAAAGARQACEKTANTQQNLTAGLTAGLAAGLTAGLTSDLACMLRNKGSVNGTLQKNELKNTIGNGQNDIIRLDSMVRNPQNEDAKRQVVTTPAAQTRRTTYTPEWNNREIVFHENNMPGDDEEASGTAACGELAGELAKLRGQVLEQQGVIERLGRDLAAERARFDDLEAKVDASHAQAPDVRTDRDPMLQKALDTIQAAGENSAAPSLEYQLDAANARIAMLENKVQKYNNMEEDLEKFQLEAAVFKKEAEDLRNNPGSELELQKRKMRDNNELELVLNKLRQDLHAANAEIAELRDKVSDYEAMKTALARSTEEVTYLKDKARDCKALQQALKEAEYDFQQCNAELQKAKADLLEGDKKFEVLEGKLAMVRAEVGAEVGADAKEAPVENPSKPRGIFSRFKKTITR